MDLRMNNIVRATVKVERGEEVELHCGEESIAVEFDKTEGHLSICAFNHDADLEVVSKGYGIIELRIVYFEPSYN